MRSVGRLYKLVNILHSENFSLFVFWWVFLVFFFPPLAVSGVLHSLKRNGFCSCGLVMPVLEESSSHMSKPLSLPRYICFADLSNSNLTGVFLEVSRIVLGLLVISSVQQVPCVWPHEVSCCSCVTFFQHSLRKMRSPWLWEQANIHLQLSHLPAAALNSPAGLEAQPHQKKAEIQL